MLMIGAGGRNSGKTELACALLKKFGADREIIAAKVTAVTSRDGACPRGGKGCGTCSSMKGDYCITEEKETQSGKDTSRFLGAGAKRVFWLRVMKTHLCEGAVALLDAIGRDAVSICESNSLRHVVEPDLFLIVRYGRSQQLKDSAAAVIELADRLVLSDGKKFDLDLADIALVGDRWALREHANVIVMAGGQSTRMGQDKSMLPIDGGPMIERVCDQVRHNFDEILISANEPEKYAFLKVKVVQDTATGQGPLMGIAAALEVSASELNFVVACDMPELDLHLARRMLREADGYDAVVLRAGERVEPLFAVYRKSLAATAGGLLESGERQIRKLFDQCRTKYIEIDDADRLRNLNTMEEYEKYIRCGNLP
jgi:molybdenum cofactor guanylyltransferase